VSRKLRYDIPGTDFRLDPEAVREEGWRAQFGLRPEAAISLVLEIGFCRGEFLMDLAREHPERCYVGIECSYKRVHKMARRLAATPIRNLRLLLGYGEIVAPAVFEERSLSEIWINFPDPWPKRNHERRRIIRPPVVAQFASLLAAGGMLHVATDDVDYGRQMHAVLSAEPQLENANAPRPWLSDVPGRKPTAYELEWRARNRPLHFFAYRRPEG